MAEITLGENWQVWRCLACGDEFAWHAGLSGLARPSMCGACDEKDPFKLLRVAFDKEMPRV